MANTVPGAEPAPDIGDLLAGSPMDTIPIAELAAAINWAIAYQGTGTPRIAQTYARRGNTVKTGVLVYTANAAQQVAQWRIPDTRGATEVLCYVHGSSVGGLGTFEFRSVTGGGVTGAQTLPAVADLVKLQGDVAKGRAVFERAESSCVLCHRIGDKGFDFGPGLGEIGAKLPKEQIYENIINPSAGLSMGFETTQLTLKDGSTGLGIVRSETRHEVVLALPGGATNRFEKVQIAKREKLTTSMMPSGLNQVLTQDDLVNLVEYLASLKPQK